MKTRMMKMMGWMLMIVGMMSLTSCEVEIRPWHDDVYHSDYTGELCSRTWEESWVENGKDIHKNLTFIITALDEIFYASSIGTDTFRKTLIVSTGDGMMMIAYVWSTVRVMCLIWKISGFTTTH